MTRDPAPWPTLREQLIADLRTRVNAQTADKTCEPLEPFADWRDQTRALEQLDAGLTRHYWRALGANR